MQIRSLFILPIGAVLISCIAMLYPSLLTGGAKAIVPLLGIVMFSMGLTLQPSDFMRVLQQPKLIFLGVCLQYLAMPLIAWVLGHLLNLPLMLTTGLILLGACPGGTASNVICFLARANVALSVSLTSISTLLAVLLTPLMTLFYVDQSIAVPIYDMVKNLFLIIVFPVFTGVLINLFFQQRLSKIKLVLPLISVLSIIFIIGVIVANNHTQLFEVGVLLFCAVALHNVFGLIAGYMIPKLMGYDKTVCKTLSIEVGMQNSGLAAVLATEYFSSLAALPSALFSVWHNVTGSILAVFWNRKND